MSRLGKKPITVPNNVNVNIENGMILVSTEKGRLEYKIPGPIKVELKDKIITVTETSDSEEYKSLHGLVRTLICNMIKGVVDGYKKELEIRGVGYKAQIKDGMLVILLGFSHPIEYKIPEGITIETPKPTNIIIKGLDKAKVGQVAAELRDLYKPEPYKGKGIRYVGEYVKKKAGKTVA